MKAVRLLYVFLVFTCVWAIAQTPRKRDPEIHDPPNPTALLRVEILAEDEGRTTVALVASSDFQPFGYRHYRIKGEEPREVFHLRGIERLLEGDIVEVGDANVIKIRLGLHPEHNPPELNVVFDLTNESVLTESVAYAGNRLVVSFVAPGVAPMATPAIAAATRTPTPTAVLKMEPAPIVTPIVTPIATPTSVPTMTPIATPVQEPAEVPDLVPTAAPTVISVKPTMIPLVVSLQPTPETRPGATDFQVDDDVMTFSEISMSRWPDGSTLIRISADRDIPADRISHFRLFGEPPRYVITVSGAKAPDLPGVVEFSDANLRRVRLIRRSANKIGELQFVLELVATGATIEKVAHQGPHIALRIVPPPG